MVKNTPANAADSRDVGLIPGLRGSSEVATGNVLAWKIPWTEEPGRLQSMGSTKCQTQLATEHT